MNMKELYRAFLESTGVSTDSRAVKEGSLFFALKGENFDGNDFALKAIECGARYAVVDRVELAGEEGIIVVEDTLTALQSLARYHRSQFNIPVIGLTGTNGKTTTKELISSVLSKKYSTLSTTGNLNNHIGVPLTLLRLEKGHEIAVVEMGASNPGEIESSTKIALPTFGLITNVGKAHLLGFGSFDGVKKTKGELYDYLQRTADHAFVNVDNTILVDMATQRPDLKIIPYGVAFSNSKVLQSDENNPYLRVELSNGKVINSNLIGAYNADNIMAALKVGEYFGVDLDDAIQAIEEYIPTNNRSQLKKIGDTTYIIDAYNANPTSMRASITNFANSSFKNKVVILGDMLELGEFSVDEHKKIVELVHTSNFSSEYYVGKEFEKAGATPVFDSSEKLAEHLLSVDLSEKSILVKGSRGIRLEKVLPQG